MKTRAELINEIAALKEEATKEFAKKVDWQQGYQKKGSRVGAEEL